MTQIQTITHEIFGSIRILDRKDKPWFVASDVAKALGYVKISNAVSTHCKNALKQGVCSASGNRRTSIIPESDVYRLVMRSKLPTAEQFQDWVVEEVLPQIRKTGSYQSAPALPKSYAEALRELADKTEQAEEQAKQLEEAKPKVDFYDTVTESDTVCQMAVAAQTAGLPFGRNKLFQKLREMGVLLSGGERHNLPKQEYITVRKYFTVKEHAVENPKTGEPIVRFTTYVTQRGIDYLVKMFSINRVA